LKTKCKQIFVLAFLSTGLMAAAQTATTSSQALQPKTVLAQSLATLCGGNAVGDLVLSGTATRPVGSSSETSPATLEMKGTAATKLTFGNSASLSRSETCNSQAGIPSCWWTDADGVSHAVPLHNSEFPVWFAPHLSSLAAVSSTNTGVTYVGHEVHNGIPTEHYSITQAIGSPKMSGSNMFLGDVIQTNWYLDSTTGLPVALTYYIHPDADARMNIPAEVRFSNYKSVNGVLIPFSITRLINNAVVLDFAVTSAKVNVGLSDSEFISQ
jgi:hypothetical protein